MNEFSEVPPVVAEIVKDPFPHDFFQALRRLQLSLPMVPIGTALRPKDSRVRMRQDASLAFAPSTISGANWDKERERIELSLRHMGLLGPNGPMPMAITEYVLDRKRHSDDPTLHFFLNFFQQRIYELFFRAWALNQPVVDFEQEGQRRHSGYLRALAGLGTPGMEACDSIPETSRLYYSGWLSGVGRSSEGLGSILSDFLKVPAEIVSFRGIWLDLPKDSACRLGGSPANGTLGSSIYAGERIWVAHLKFRIRLGPLTLAQFQELLPNRKAFQQIKDWVRFYAGETFWWEVQLLLKAEEVPPCTLGGSAQLGWTTWMGRPSANAGSTVNDTVLQGAA